MTSNQSGQEKLVSNITELSQSFCWSSELYRYFSFSVFAVVQNPPKYDDVICEQPLNTFDFPTINEDYRRKKYCYTYGMNTFAYSRTALVKKNVCTSEDDKVLYKENHYMSEMHFLPNPGKNKIL